MTSVDQCVWQQGTENAVVFGNGSQDFAQRLRWSPSVRPNSWRVKSLSVVTLGVAGQTAGAGRIVYICSGIPVFACNGITMGGAGNQSLQVFYVWNFIYSGSGSNPTGDLVFHFMGSLASDVIFNVNDYVLFDFGNLVINKGSSVTVVAKYEYLNPTQSMRQGSGSGRSAPYATEG